MLSVFEKITTASLVEAGAILLIVLLAILTNLLVGRRDAARAGRVPSSHIWELIRPLLLPLMVLVMLMAGEVAWEKVRGESNLISFAVKLGVGWLAIRIILTLRSGKAAKWLIALIVVPVTLLHVLGLWQPLAIRLESIAFMLGDSPVTLLNILKATLSVVLLIWLTARLTVLGEHQLSRVNSMRPSDRTLVIRALQICLYIIIFLVALSIAGLPLTALTVFGGALGVGVGFGLQKIAANFVSGIILLFEKSIESNDLVEMSDGAYGFIRRTSARFTLLETFDGKEILIPNEEFINTRVINWTFSNTKGRVEITLGVSYRSDIEQAQTLILEAAREHPRCSQDPQPVCYLTGFGDSSVNFVLFFWVDDVRAGRFQPRHDVMLSIWRKFKENGIEIPFPQRDLHIKEPIALLQGVEKTAPHP